MNSTYKWYDENTRMFYMTLGSKFYPSILNLKAGLGEISFNQFHVWLAHKSTKPIFLPPVFLFLFFIPLQSKEKTKSVTQ